MTTILHVEDDPDLAMGVKEAFEAFGFRGTHLTAGTVAEGRAILADAGAYPIIDLIISDMHLPDGSGLDVVRSARSNPVRDQVPIVILSGDANPEGVTRAYALGANSYVSKRARGRSASQVMSTLYQYWLRDARLPTPRHVTRTYLFVAKAVKMRTRKFQMYLRVAEQLGTSEGRFWKDLALREGNLANVLTFLLGQLGDRELSDELLDEAEPIQARSNRELDLMEQQPVRTRDDAQGHLLAFILNIRAEVAARVTAELFPHAPVVITALRETAASSLDEIAAWIEAHSADPRLREQILGLRADAARLRS